MSDTILQIAARLHQTREALGITPAEVADKVGIDVALYDDYENAKVDIPIGFLTRFSDAFGIPLPSLLSGEEPKLSAFTLTRKGKGLHVERYPGYAYIAHAHKFAHKKCEPFHVTVSPEEGPVRMNAHVGHEFDFVLRGKIKVTIGDKEVVLEEGDSVYLDSAYMHGIVAMDDEAEFLAIVMR